MSLAQAEWQDILRVLHETYRIWSPGLTRSDYQQYTWNQISHPWARRHFRFMVQKHAGNVVTSCKLYDLVMQARGREYRVLGIGAIYTQEKYRQTGRAHELLQNLRDLASNEGYDGLLLY